MSNAVMTIQSIADRRKAVLTEWEGFKENTKVCSPFRPSAYSIARHGRYKLPKQWLQAKAPHLYSPHITMPLCDVIRPAGSRLRTR